MLRSVIIFFTIALAAVTFSIVAMMLWNSQKLNVLSATFIDHHYLARGPMFTSHIEDEAVRRALLYNEIIKESFLEDGMLVERDRSGNPLSKCDSLLFSSLRFVALNKLGLQEDALQAWQAIERSQSQGRWQRHPNCEHRLSRDMILGVLAALTQNPPNAREHLINLLQHLDLHGGFAGDGPLHVSYITPGIAELIRQLALVYEIPSHVLPLNVRYGFSTLELNALAVPAGYRSHLNALIIWIELEIESLRQQSGLPSNNIRSLPLLIDRTIATASRRQIKKYRQQWVAEQLVRVDAKNLFFRWLRYRTAGVINDQIRNQMLQQLVTMPQFPSDRTPDNCDRAADYLWQRASREHQPITDHCYKLFNGADFLWMAALLLPQ